MMKKEMEKRQGASNLMNLGMVKIMKKIGGLMESWWKKG